MKRSISFLALLMLMSMGLYAQHKSELEAQVKSLTAKNDSLAKVLATANAQNVKQARLIDTLSVLTGVHVNDLDTVEAVMKLRASNKMANKDSLTEVRLQAAKLQLAMDSVSQAYTKLQQDCNAARAAVAADTAGTSPTDQVGQLMKLNSMLEQGLLTKDEFLKMKGDLMK